MVGEVMDAYWEVWEWAMTEWEIGNRIKASKLLRISEKMKLLHRQSR
jgi:hypothetical protein